GVRHGEPAHEAGEVTILAGPEQEVEVVGHEARGQQPHVRARDGLGEDALECGIIPFGPEESQAGVGPVEGVVDEAALPRSSWAWHVPQVGPLSSSDRGACPAVGVDRREHRAGIRRWAVVLVVEVQPADYFVAGDGDGGETARLPHMLKLMRYVPVFPPRFSSLA